MTAFEHTLVAGLLPQEGEAILKALDRASALGFAVIHTTACAENENSVYYVATLAREKEEPPAPTRMTGGLSVNKG